MAGHNSEVTHDTLTVYPVALAVTRGKAAARSQNKKTRKEDSQKKTELTAVLVQWSRGF